MSIKIQTAIMQTSVVLVLCAVAVSSIVEAKHLFPPYITQCSRSNLEECVLKNAEAIRPHLGKGVARLGNNITTKNIGDYQLKHFNFDFDKNVLEMEVNFPKLEPVADYIMQGAILGIALDTSGKGLGTFTNLNIKSKLSGELIKKNGKDYFNITDKSFEVTDMEDAYIYLYSLPASTNEVINMHTKEFLKGMGPVMETYVGAIVEGTVRHVFEIYALDDLFTK